MEELLGPEALVLGKITMAGKKLFGKRNKLLVCILAGTMLLLCGCKAKLPDTYVEGEDSQYFQRSGLLKNPSVQQTVEGCYVLHGEYVYFYDKASGQYTPLCNKPNCLHDRETDPDKKADCNAYLDDMWSAEYPEVCLQLSEPYLYAFYSSDSFGFTLCRLGKDGSLKEEIWTTQEPVSEFMVHRGYAYLSVGGYIPSEEGLKADFQILEMDLTKTHNIQSEEIFSYQTERLASLGDIAGYGNYIYFELSEGDEHHLYCYSTENEELKEIEVEALSAVGQYVNNITFFRDKLMLIGYKIDMEDRVEELYHPTNIYMAELDGSNPQMVLEDIPQGYYIGSDGKYFYLNNAFNVKFGKPELDSEKTFWVYDENMKLVDTFLVPDTADGLFDPPLGNQDTQYLHFQDEEKWGLQIWDKSLIGTYHGSAYQQEEIVYKVFEEQ